MEIVQEHTNQTSELKKLGFAFYQSLAYGNEPLTYSVMNPETKVETQVEVNARMSDQNDGLIVEIGFDTNFGGRFDKTKGSFFVFSLSREEVWSKIS